MLTDGDLNWIGVVPRASHVIELGPCMIDITNKQLIPLHDEPRLLSPRSNERRIHISAVYRWIQRGAGGGADRGGDVYQRRSDAAVRVTFGELGLRAELRLGDMPEANRQSSETCRGNPLSRKIHFKGTVKEGIGSFNVKLPFAPEPAVTEVT
jgi:hypothetical protein